MSIQFRSCSFSVNMLLALVLVMCGVAACAQTATPVIPKSDIPSLSFALTYSAVGSTTINNNRFWMQGGAAELTGTFYRGIGATASVLGVHTANSGNGVPINLVVAAFGPRYSYRVGVKKHSAILFGQVLAGEAFGFDGMYPGTTGNSSTANSFALQPGGGIDINLTRHVSLRALQADYLYTRLPNSSNDHYQNNVRLGAGIVIHSAAR